MKHKHDGFTLIEVSLFIAVSGLVLMSVIGMASVAISQQRFNDATQNFAEFLRRVYSEVENPQSIGSGRSQDYVIYGKLVTFGESYDFSGAEVLEQQKIFVYDVVGKDATTGTGTTLGMIEWLNMDAIMIQKDIDDEPFVERAGMIESYTPRWAAVIDSTANGVPFEGSLLIVRHPRSGKITTLVAKGSDGVIEVNKELDGEDGRADVAFAESSSLIVEKLDSFSSEQIDFCVNMNGYGNTSGSRRDVRILKNARDASGVLIVELDGEENACNS